METSRDYEAAISQFQTHVLDKFGDLTTYRCDKCSRLATEHENGSVFGCAMEQLSGEEYVASLKRQLNELGEFYEGVQRDVGLSEEKERLEGEMSEMANVLRSLADGALETVQDAASFVTGLNAQKAGRRSEGEVDGLMKALLRRLSRLRDRANHGARMVAEDGEVARAFAAAEGEPSLDWDDSLFPPVRERVDASTSVIISTPSSTPSTGSITTMPSKTVALACKACVSFTPSTPALPPSVAAVTSSVAAVTSSVAAVTSSVSAVTSSVTAISSSVAAVTLSGTAMAPSVATLPSSVTVVHSSVPAFPPTSILIPPSTPIPSATVVSAHNLPHSHSLTSVGMPFTPFSSNPNPITSHQSFMPNFQSSYYPTMHPPPPVGVQYYPSPYPFYHPTTLPPPPRSASAAAAVPPPTSTFGGGGGGGATAGLPDSGRIYRPSAFTATRSSSRSSTAVSTEGSSRHPSRGSRSASHVSPPRRFTDRPPVKSEVLKGEGEE